MPEAFPLPPRSSGGRGAYGLRKNGRRGFFLCGRFFVCAFMLYTLAEFGRNSTFSVISMPLARRWSVRIEGFAFPFSSLLMSP